MTPQPVIGWRQRKWRTPIPCVVCGQLCRKGVTAHNDAGPTPVRAMCRACYRRIMADPGPAEPTEDDLRRADERRPCETCGLNPCVCPDWRLAGGWT